MKIYLFSLALLPALLWGAPTKPFINFESPQVHPLDLSPDGRWLVACNTADNRVELWAVDETGALAHQASVPVGYDPVSVRFRSATELWVANHVSDSVSIVDLTSLQVVRTLATRDEPCDIVFAGEPRQAYVSCASTNTILRYDLANLDAEPMAITIEGEDPRALAVSPDGRTVYSAIFESGNGTTILMGGFEGPTPGSAHDGGAAEYMPNLVGWTERQLLWRGPYRGQNPAPNDGDDFKPALNPANPPAPEVGHIVKYDPDSERWLDDNNGDWTRLVAGDISPYIGRRSDWELVDNDVAIIDTATGEISYAERMMHIGMALGVNPVTGQVLLVGTEATNVIRFEPNINGTFVRVMAGLFAADAPARPLTADLNPHLDYSVSTIPAPQRHQSIGDPRGIAWSPSGDIAYVAGRGSNNLIIIDGTGERAGRAPTIPVGEGPTGLVHHPSLPRLYVLNQFDGSLSLIDTEAQIELGRTPFFDPTPPDVKAGRPFLYNTHLTSGLGQAACASCHVDARMDRLAWDLGNPAGEMIPLNRDQHPKRLTYNLGGGIDFEPEVFTDLHPMKGPMKTPTLQDVVGKEPLHWRGDRRGIEDFNGAFQSLQGAERQLTDPEMAALKRYLASLHFPPNPYRHLDNTLPTDLPLPGFFSGPTFTEAGTPLPNGDAQRGLDTLFRPFERGIDNELVACVTCHALPSGVGMAARYNERSGRYEKLPLGPDGNAHHLLIASDGSVQKTMKSSQLRNLYDQTGYDLTQQRSLSGFGIQHDGAIPNLAWYFESLAFTPENLQEVADLTALMMAFSGSDFGPPVDAYEPPKDTSRDAHAAVGQQVTLRAGEDHGRLPQFMALADARRVELIAKRGHRGWLYAGQGLFRPDRQGPAQRLDQILGDEPLTFTVVPRGTGRRWGIDRDQDGLLDGEDPEPTAYTRPVGGTPTSLVPLTYTLLPPARPNAEFAPHLHDN